MEPKECGYCGGVTYLGNVCLQCRSGLITSDIPFPWRGMAILFSLTLLAVLGSFLR